MCILFKYFFIYLRKFTLVPEFFVGKMIFAISLKYQYLLLVLETDQEEVYNTVYTDRQRSPKHTTTEKWIIDRQKRKVLTEQIWAQKQQKTAQKIAVSSDMLKVGILIGYSSQSSVFSFCSMLSLDIMDHGVTPLILWMCHIIETV